MKSFNVILVDFNSKEITPYDVLPYFRDQFVINNAKISIKSKSDLREWIIRESHYQFWSRCEYEHLVGSWPFIEGKDKLIKIDVHQQIMINIDIITDILAEELGFQH